MLDFIIYQVVLFVDNMIHWFITHVSFSFYDYCRESFM